MRLCSAPQQRAVTRGSPKTLPAAERSPPDRAQGSDRLPRMGPAPAPCSGPLHGMSSHSAPRSPPPPPHLCWAPAQCPAKAASCSAPWCPIHAPPPDQTKTPEGLGSNPSSAHYRPCDQGRSLPEPRSSGDERGLPRGAEFSVHKITSAGPVESARHMERAGKWLSLTNPSSPPCLRRMDRWLGKGLLPS